MARLPVSQNAISDPSGALDHSANSIDGQLQNLPRKISVAD